MGHGPFNFDEQRKEQMAVERVRVRAREALVYKEIAKALQLAENGRAADALLVREQQMRELQGREKREKKFASSIMSAFDKRIKPVIILHNATTGTNLPRSSHLELSKSESSFRKAVNGAIGKSKYQKFLSFDRGLNQILLIYTFFRETCY